MHAEPHVWTQFWNSLCASRGDQTAYVYRLDADGRAVRPYWLKGAGDLSLPTAIQRRGGGRVRVIIRRGRTMVFSGFVSL